MLLLYAIYSIIICYNYILICSWEKKLVYLFGDDFNAEKNNAARLEICLPKKGSSVWDYPDSYAFRVEFWSCEIYMYCTYVNWHICIYIYICM